MLSGQGRVSYDISPTTRSLIQTQVGGAEHGNKPSSSSALLLILSDDILAPIKYKEIYNELINSSKAYASFLGPNGHSRTLRQVPNNLDEAYMLILIINKDM